MLGDQSKLGNVTPRNTLTYDKKYWILLKSYISVSAIYIIVCIIMVIYEV